MGPLIALSVSAFSGGLLLILAVTLIVVFPRLPAARLWAFSWVLAALGCLLVAVSPFLELYFASSAELTLRTAAVLSSVLALSLGYLAWFQISPDRGKGALVRTALWGGSFLALVPVVLGFTSSSLVLGVLVAAWSAVPVAVSVHLVAWRGMGASQPPVRAQSASLLFSLVVGPVPFVLSWLVLPAFPGLGWSLGVPAFLVLGAVLTLRSLIHFDTRFHHHQTTPFLLEKTQDTVLFLESDGTVQAMNPALKFLLDLDEEAVVGRPLAGLGADEESRRALKPLEDLTFPDWEGTLALSHRTGRPVPVHLVFRRIHNPAREAVGAVLLVYDLRLPRRLDLSSREDQLTALSNRRWVLELLEAEFHRVKRYGGPLAALWITLDHLDEVEQQFGTEAADDVLRRLGAILRGGLRKTDFCGRIGNRDFLVVLPETIEERALLVSGRLEKMFALSTEGESSGVVLRIGSASLDETSESTEDFVALVKASVPPALTSV